MKITKWTDDNGAANYIDPGEERHKYWNFERNKIEKESLDTLRNKTFNSDEEKDAAWKEYFQKLDAIPCFTDEAKVAEWEEIQEQYCEAIVQCLIDTGIRISQEDHQCGYIPVADDKYVMMFTFRAWSGILAEVWNRLHPEGPTRDYLDYYCQGTGDEKRVLPEDVGMVVEHEDI